jgi:hypothetical protein
VTASSVDLPAPFGPMSAIAAGRDVEVDPAQRQLSR